MATTSTPNLETRIRVDETGYTLTIAYFAVAHDPRFEHLENMEFVTVADPLAQREHLATLKIALVRPTELIGMVRFELERESEGRDIPMYLPNDIRYHVLMTSSAIFDLLAEQSK